MVSDVVWLRELDSQQGNEEEVRGDGNVVCQEDVEDPVNGKEDKLGGIAKGGSEKRVDGDDKEQANWYCGAHIGRKRFRERLSSWNDRQEEEKEEGRG